MMTKSKILSNTGVEIGGAKLNSIVNNNINITAAKADAKADAKVDAIEIPVEYSVEESDKVNCSEIEYVNKNKAITFLKKIINLYATSNMLKIDGKFVLRNDDLIDVIKLIIETNYSDIIKPSVDIKVDYEINCCGTSKGLNIVNKILINETHDMKYVYNEEYNTLMQMGISLKYTVD